MEFQPVKGTRDFYPGIMAERNRVFGMLRRIAEKYGFREVESPAFESLKLLAAKSGDEVKGQIFVLEKRSSEEIALRFDLTVPLARMFVARQKELPKPVKWFYITRMWRYEAPQKGRLREFYQFGVELFGSSKPEADAEVISLGIDCLESLGLRPKDFVVRINNREFLEGFLESQGITEIERTLRTVDKKGKLSEQEFEEELSFLDANQTKSLLSFLNSSSLDSIDAKGNEKCIAGIGALKSIFSTLDKMGKKEYIQFAPDVARGLGYYTGTVFEFFDRAGKYRAILGGGRYDRLVEQFGGESCPTTGFAMGDVVLELFLRERGLWDAGEGKSDCVDYYVAPVSKDFFDQAIEIASMLRKNSSVEIDLMERKLAKQLTYANSIRARKVVIVGEEAKSGRVKIKDMETGDEKEVSINDASRI